MQRCQRKIKQQKRLKRYADLKWLKEVSAQYQAPVLVTQPGILSDAEKDAQRKLLKADVAQKVAEQAQREAEAARLAWLKTQSEKEAKRRQTSLSTFFPCLPGAASPRELLAALRPERGAAHPAVATPDQKKRKAQRIALQAMQESESRAKRLQARADRLAVSPAVSPSEGAQTPGADAIVPQELFPALNDEEMVAAVAQELVCGTLPSTSKRGRKRGIVRPKMSPSPREDLKLRRSVGLANKIRPSAQQQVQRAEDILARTQDPDWSSKSGTAFWNDLEEEMQLPQSWLKDMVSKEGQEKLKTWLTLRNVDKAAKRRG